MEKTCLNFEICYIVNVESTRVEKNSCGMSPKVVPIPIEILHIYLNFFFMKNNCTQHLIQRCVRCICM